MIFLYFKKLTHPSNLRCALLCLSDGSAIAFNQKLTNYVKNSKIHAFPSAKKQAIFKNHFETFFFMWKMISSTKQKSLMMFE